MTTPWVRVLRDEDDGDWPARFLAADALLQDGLLIEDDRTGDVRLAPSLAAEVERSGPGRTIEPLLRYRDDDAALLLMEAAARSAGLGDAELAVVLAKVANEAAS